jgi:uncharacterized membrane protein YgaE (UPF0421/DUF939 family)
MGVTNQNSSFLLELMVDSSFSNKIIGQRLFLCFDGVCNATFVNFGVIFI